MKKYKFHLFFLFCLSLSIISSAQTGKLRIANKHFENLSYVNAIRNYEDFLKNSKSQSADECREAATKLGFCYRKLQDSRGAERVYRKLIEDYPETVESETYLYFAQSLANNSKYRESQRMYSKYGELQTADMRGKRFTVAYMDNSKFFKDSSQYKVDFLQPLNTRQSDFSPMYYQGGIVFVSARNEAGGIKRVFEHNETPFLDLYMFPDTAQLMPKDKAAKNLVGAIGGGSSDEVELDANPRIGKDGEKALSKVEQFSKTLNSKYHEGPVTFFKDEKKLIFTRNNYLKGRARESGDGINKLKLYSAEIKGKSWGSVKELPFNSNDYSTGHPTLSPDNTKMYFVSDMPGGYGGTDVYVVEVNGGRWGTPVNLGKEINTEGNEMFPFCDDSGNLYFASDGHEGLGGLDMFFVEMKESIPTGEVTNLGAPINSERDDFGLITNSSRSSGYFSSNRRKGYSDDNIYAFKRSCKELNLLVYDNDKREPLDSAQVRVIRNGSNGELMLTGANGLLKICVEPGMEYELMVMKEGYAPNSITYGTLSSRKETNIKMYLEKSKAPIVRGVVSAEVNAKPIVGATVTLQNERDGSKQTVVTGQDGRYEFQTQTNASYSITASKDNYATNTEEIGKVRSTRRGPKVVETNVGLVGEGDVFQLYNIYYDLNQFFIRPDAAAELDARLVPLLQKYPDMKIEIRSHTDSRATDLYNTRLSENRARAVVDYLIARGVRPARLLSKGYGETALMNDCRDGINCSEYDHQQNRRTEFRILTTGENQELGIR